MLNRLMQGTWKAMEFRLREIGIVCERNEVFFPPIKSAISKRALSV